MNIPKLPGIYSIENTINGKKYVGSTSNLYKRFYQHVANLRRKKHVNRHLQSAFDLYGEANFTFNIEFDCDKEDMFIFEQAMIDITKPEYNIIRVVGSSKGIKRTDEFRAKVSKALKDKPNAQSIKHYGKTVLSPDGTAYTIDRCVTTFCRNHGLNVSHFLKVLNGSRKSSQGWSICQS